MSAHRVPLTPAEDLKQIPEARRRGLSRIDAVDLAGLQAELEKNVEGEVRFDAAGCKDFARDVQFFATRFAAAAGVWVVNQECVTKFRGSCHFARFRSLESNLHSI